VCLLVSQIVREFDSMTHNESVFAMAGYSVFCHACTKVDFCFIVEDTFCRLIYTVKPELKLNKDLLLIASMSSPAIANTFCCAQCLVSFIKSIQDPKAFHLRRFQFPF